MSNPHPVNAGKGRPKGVPNKLPKLLKEMILTALEQAGGVQYLVAQAQKNPTAFLALIGRVLPIQVKEGGAEPMMPRTVIHEFHDSAPRPGEESPLSLSPSVVRQVIHECHDA